MSRLAKRGIHSRMMINKNFWSSERRRMVGTHKGEWRHGYRCRRGREGCVCLCSFFGFMFVRADVLLSFVRGSYRNRIVRDRGYVALFCSLVASKVVVWYAVVIDHSLSCGKRKAKEAKKGKLRRSLWFHWVSCIGIAATVVCVWRVALRHHLGEGVYDIAGDLVPEE